MDGIHSVVNLTFFLDLDIGLGVFLGNEFQRNTTARVVTMVCMAWMTAFSGSGGFFILIA